jgi:ergothioneine biosynthesis protein EgtB
VHKAYVNAFKLMNRPVTNGEHLEFIDDGGYDEFSNWLAESWDDGDMRPVLRLADREVSPMAPLYWQLSKDGWQRFTLHGWQPLDPDEPVSHVSYFEAAAYARWRSRLEDVCLRLPTEMEWEHAARTTSAMDTIAADEPALLDGGCYRPVMVEQAAPLKHMIGNVWEWTNSAYLQHPGFRPYDGTIQEYNGKFMSNKMVLKGGSWATPAHHIRVSYRNFWPHAFRFAIPGIRLLREPS